MKFPVWFVLIRTRIIAEEGSSRHNFTIEFRKMSEYFKLGPAEILENHQIFWYSKNKKTFFSLS